MNAEPARKLIYLDSSNLFDAVKGKLDLLPLALSADVALVVSSAHFQDIGGSEPLNWRQDLAAFFNGFPNKVFIASPAFIPVLEFERFAASGGSSVQSPPQVMFDTDDEPKAILDRLIGPVQEALLSSEGLASAFAADAARRTMSALASILAKAQSKADVQTPEHLAALLVDQLSTMPAEYRRVIADGLAELATESEPDAWLEFSNSQAKPLRVGIYELPMELTRLALAGDVAALASLLAQTTAFGADSKGLAEGQAWRSFLLQCVRQSRLDLPAVELRGVFDAMMANPSGCPGWTLVRKLDEAMEADRQTPGKASDEIDVAHAAAIPYVDVAFVDKRILNYMKRKELKAYAAKTNLASTISTWMERNPGTPVRGRITRFVADGYRSLGSVGLPDMAGPMVLIGPNGAGKSNLLSALRLLTRMNDGRLQDSVTQLGGANQVLHHGMKATSEISIELRIEHDNGVHNYAARLGATDTDKLVFLGEVVRAGIPDSEFSETGRTYLGSQHSESKLSSGIKEKWPTRIVHALLERVVSYHFHDTSPSSPMRLPSVAASGFSLMPDGGNLAAFLATLQKSGEVGEAAFGRIQGLVRRVAPFIRELRPRALPGDVVRLDWRDESGNEFGPQHLSDGTLRLIALFTALAQPAHQMPLVCAIDEPELGLHPAALSLFAELVHSAAATTQVIITTQSPALLDHFDPQAVVVVERVQGRSTFRQLPAAELGTWLDEYSLSELYESNALGGRP